MRYDVYAANGIVGILRLGNDVEIIDAHKLHRYVLLGYVKERRKKVIA